jgi:predicted phage-related endonuclease
MSHALQPLGNNAEKPHRRSFIGGSDAPIIMGSDENALIRLWREKRGEAEPRTCRGILLSSWGR